MISRSIARLVLLWVVVGVVSPAVGESLLATSADEASHAGSSCPDSSDSGHPCGPACPCACCPGHSTAPALAVAGAVRGSPGTARFKVAALESAHPEDVYFRVFHPPRS
ncbi:MAG: hypothetical protein IT371_11870 [Deltaproteobacteria bacterium]|nr:hypothetical protein [Deltaproteobacteria bacterium]